MTLVFIIPISVHIDCSMDCTRATFFFNITLIDYYYHLRTIHRNVHSHIQCVRVARNALHVSAKWSTVFQIRKHRIRVLHGQHSYLRRRKSRREDAEQPQQRAQIKSKVAVYSCSCTVYIWIYLFWNYGVLLRYEWRLKIISSPNIMTFARGTTYFMVINFECTDINIRYQGNRLHPFGWTGNVKYYYRVSFSICMTAGDWHVSRTPAHDIPRTCEYDAKTTRMIFMT